MCATMMQDEKARDALGIAGRMGRCAGLFRHEASYFVGSFFSLSLSAAGA